MSKKLTVFDAAEYLDSGEAIAVFLSEAFATNDASYISHALGIVARARGMTEVAKAIGLSREQLYRSFSKRGNPTLKMTLAVLTALGIDLMARVHKPAQSAIPSKRGRALRESRAL